jgi:hypothetical protein
MRIGFEGSGVNVIGVNEIFLTQSVSSKAVEIVGYRFLRNDRSVFGRPVTGGGVGLYLKNKLVAKSSQVGVEYIFAEIRLPHKTLLVGSVYMYSPTSVVYHLLGAQGYSLSILEEVYADILPGYEDVYLFGDFNVNLLDSSDGLFETLCGFLESFRLYNVPISPTRAASGKLLDLFLVANKSEVVDFFPNAVVVE